MSLLRTIVLLALSVLLAACSGSDAPPTATVATTASSAKVAPPAAADNPMTAPPVTIPPTATAAPGAVTTPAAEALAPATASPSTAAATSSTNATPATATSDPTYEVQCAPGATAAEQCQVDKDTYIGWRTFAAQCQVCHGGSALGSTFAPSLLDRFHQRVDHARFVEVVTHGFRGQVGAMPAWKGNPNVMPHIDQLYRYLKARADGVLPAGRPARKL